MPYDLDTAAAIHRVEVVVPREYPASYEHKHANNLRRVLASSFTDSLSS